MNVESALKQLAEDPGTTLDVAEVALSLALDEFPDLDVEAYLQELEGMAHEASTYLTGDLKTRVSGLCRYLFHEMGFRGNNQNYYDARNSYLNQVLDRRTGIPITLSVVAMAVGKRAGLNVVGVGLPGHFIAKAIDDETEILFDPFHGGRLLTCVDCENLVSQVTGEPFEATSAQLEAVPPSLILRRMLTNLKLVYFKQGDFHRAVSVMKRLCQLTPGDLSQSRDLGLCLIQDNQFGQAINPLSVYLNSMPPPEDRDEVKCFLERAQNEVAKWN